MAALLMDDTCKPDGRPGREAEQDGRGAERPECPDNFMFHLWSAGFCPSMNKMLLKRTETHPYHLMLCCLMLVGFAARLYMAHTDPFLHLWDERFHALVARNMMDAPLQPMLRAYAVLPPDPFSWTQSGLWLHKPPLFLWQMALSMKLFGTTVYALRYPSVLMGTLMIPMLYSIVARTTNDRRIAIITAALFCFSNFHLELVAGIRSMDHNDLCLEFYVLASIWAWVRYEEKRQGYWLILIGVFAGTAILTKWLIGLFVFLVWGIKLLLELRQRLDVKEAGRLLLSLLVCCIVFLPWQFFILKHWPAEAAFEYEFNRRHITEALEGHEGNGFFYLARLPQLLGEGIFLLILPGLLLWYRSKQKVTTLTVALLSGTLFVLLFFSLIVKTKVISHVYFVAPFAMMLMAYALDFIINKIQKRNWLLVVLVAGVFVLDAKPEKILLDQYVNNEQRLKDMHNASIYKSVGSTLTTNAVVINVPDCISFMFFNKGTDAYQMLAPKQMKILESEKKIIFAFDHVSNHPLPAYVLQYPYLRLLHGKLQ